MCERKNRPITHYACLMESKAIYALQMKMHTKERKRRRRRRKRNSLYNHIFLTLYFTFFAFLPLHVCRKVKNGLIAFNYVRR
jgi:hypothetical protein